jgi:hypothetical protein
MSWLNRRRPKTSHPWPPLETREAVLAAESALMFRLPRGILTGRRAHGAGPKVYASHTVLVDELFYAPFPRTAEEWRAQGFSFIGKP